MSLIKALTTWWVEFEHGDLFIYLFIYFLLLNDFVNPLHSTSGIRPLATCWFFSHSRWKKGYGNSQWNFLWIMSQVGTYGIYCHNNKKTVEWKYFICAPIYSVKHCCYNKNYMYWTTGVYKVPKWWWHRFDYCRL